MKIVHVSDIHIRTLQRHDEYEKVFENLYRHLDEIRPDCVINTGDTAHSKINISPELVDMIAKHMRRVSEYADYHIILGNHDLNLSNRTRKDVITPIWEHIELEKHGVYLHKKSGNVWFDKGFTFWNFSIVDEHNFPKPPYRAHGFKHIEEDVNIGLFHGSVSGCVTDSNWSMRHTEYDLSIFDGLDYVLMGDIHKQQFFKNRRIAYAGSLIQQNFGEDPDKGFLLWDIKDKDNFEVKSINLTGARKFYTIKANDDLTLPEVKVDSDARVRIIPPRILSFAEQKEIKRIAKQTFQAHDVMIPPASEEIVKSVVEQQALSQEDLRDLDVQERLLKDYLKNIDRDIVTSVLAINRDLNSRIVKKDDVARNTLWKPQKFLWNGLFQYGEGNVLDLSKLGQFVGIFAPNASGKSKLIDSINYSLFNKTTTGVSRGVHLINDDLNVASSIAELHVEDKEYVIERTLDRVKKKGRDEAKGSAAFYRVTDGGNNLDISKLDNSESGLDRADTDKVIQKYIGTFEDYCLTSFSAQNNPLDLLYCKESKRKEIFYRFFNLDIFEEKRQLAKDDFKRWKARIKDANVEELMNNVKNSTDKILKIKDDISWHETYLGQYSNLLQETESTIVSLLSELPKQEKVESVSEDTIAFAKKKIEEVINDIKIYDKEISNLPEEYIPISNLLSEINDVNKKISQLEKKKTQIENARKQAEKNVKLLSEVPCGDQFPACKFLVNAFESRKFLESFDLNDLKNVERELEDLEQKRRDLVLLEEKDKENYKLFQGRKNLENARERRILNLENCKRVESDLLDKKKKYDEYVKQKEKRSEIEDGLKHYNEIKIQLQKDIADKRRVISDLIRSLGSEEAILEVNKNKLADYQQAYHWCTAYEYYDNAMGKDGIPCMILSQKLPLINEEIAKVLSAGVDFRVVIEYDSDTQSIPMYLVPANSERIRPLELASGAQKFLASIAMRAALLNNSSLPRCSTFVIDEGFGSLDPNNVENISKIFDVLRSLFEHVLIVSHLDVLKDMVDDVIEISTDEHGYAHVEVS